MKYAEIKEKMTKGKLGLGIPSLEIFSTVTGEHIGNIHIKIGVFGKDFDDEWKDEKEKSLADGYAITTAVNNTYGKGINPEAVGDLLELATIARDHMHQWTGTNGYRAPEFIDKLVKALAKAEGKEG